MVIGTGGESRVFIHRKRSDRMVSSILAGRHVVVGSLWDFLFDCDYFLSETEGVAIEREGGRGCRTCVET